MGHHIFIYRIKRPCVDYPAIFCHSFLFSLPIWPIPLEAQLIVTWIELQTPQLISIDSSLDVVSYYAITILRSTARQCSVTRLFPPLLRQRSVFESRSCQGCFSVVSVYRSRPTAIHQRLTLSVRSPASGTQNHTREEAQNSWFPFRGHVNGLSDYTTEPEKIRTLLPNHCHHVIEMLNTCRQHLIHPAHFRRNHERCLSTLTKIARYYCAHACYGRQMFPNPSAY